MFRVFCCSVSGVPGGNNCAGCVAIGSRRLIARLRGLRAGCVDCAAGRGCTRRVGADVASARACSLELVGGAAGAPVASRALVEGDGVVEARRACLLCSLECRRAAVVPPRPPLCDLVSRRDGAAAVYRAHAGHGYGMRRIATHLGCGVTTIRRRVREQATRAPLGATAAS